MKKLENLARVERERERERESYILESKNVGLLSDFENRNNNICKINNNDINTNEINILNKCSKAMCFSEN